MNRIIMLCVLLATAGLHGAQLPAAHNDLGKNAETQLPSDMQPQWNTLFKKHFTSIGIGGLIGATTGALCGYFDLKTEGNFLPLSWFMWASIRGGLKKALMHDMNLYNVPYNEKTMDFAAWICDWAAYIQYRELKTSYVQILLIAYCASSVLGFEIG